MPWVITNDKFFVRSDRRGCATPIVDKRRAKVFDERFNAGEFLRSLPKAMKNLGYYVAPEDAGVECGPSPRNILKCFLRPDEIWT